MPGVCAGFSDDVYYRAGVAAILRAKLVGHQNVLLHKLRVADKQGGATNAVVIVVLTVDLLVIIAATQAVHGETHSVGVGKVVVTRADYTWNKQRQVIQPFVLLNASEGL